MYNKSRKSEENMILQYRISSTDVENMALEYCYMTFHTTLFKKEKIQNYVNAFYKYLKASDIKYSGCFFGDQDYIYDSIKDKNGEEYYIIDLKKLNSPHDGSIGLLPLDLLELSQKEDVLATLGIEIKEGNLVPKEEQKIKEYRK